MMAKTGVCLGCFLSRAAALGALLCALTVGASAAEVGVVTGGVVNARKGPGVDCERIGSLPKGKRVTVRAEENGWYEIAWDGLTAYIRKDYVSLVGAVDFTDVACDATVSGGNINVRTGPGTNYDRVAVLGTGRRIAILGEASGWYQIAFDGKVGYIFGAYVVPDVVVADAGADREVPAAVAEASALAASDVDRVGIITGGTVNVRAGASLEAKCVTQVKAGKRVTILAKESGWCKVSFDGKDGYVRGDYVFEGAGLSPSASVGVQAAAMAAQYIGVPYVYGGSAPSGFDCSGLTAYLYRQLGCTLPHTASGQYASCGVKISRSDLQPGDLVFFTSSGAGGRINHVGVYTGDGRFVHARRSVGRVQANSLCESYYDKNYVGAVRVA